VSLAELATQGRIILRTAFSRDQPKKIYVQDLLKEDAAMVWELIQVKKEPNQTNLSLSIY
jgi:NADPH-ferrihemoprotein reductase